MNSRWIDKNYKNFKAGDIICDEKQKELYLVIKVDTAAIWCIGFVHAAFTENMDKHPVFPMWKEDLEKGGIWDIAELKLGNLDDYKELIDRIQGECVATLNLE